MEENLMPWMSINQWKKKHKIGLKQKEAIQSNGKEQHKSEANPKPKPHSNGKEEEPDLPFKLLGFDTFSSEWYSLGSFHTEGKALAAAQAKLRVLEHTQPSRSSGGQSGIQDRVFIERPDGTQARVFPQM